MAEKVSPGQRDKQAAEQRTAQVAADNKQQADQQDGDAEKVQGQPDAETAVERLATADADQATDVAVDPYPPYENKSVEELRSTAEGRDVEINRDVEKAEIVAKLRQKNPTNAQYDFMPLEDLRAEAKKERVELDEEFVKAHLITELRAADTGVNNRGDHTR